MELGRAVCSSTVSDEIPESDQDRIGGSLCQTTTEGKPGYRVSFLFHRGAVFQTDPVPKPVGAGNSVTSRCRAIW